jgi:hypothetical protein
VDCLCSYIFKIHPELPWYERGIYAGSPVGFGFTIIVFVVSVMQLIFWESQPDQKEGDANNGDKHD